jgi:hypothetical protein
MELPTDMVFCLIGRYSVYIYYKWVHFNMFKILKKKLVCSPNILCFVHKVLLKKEISYGL